MWGSSPASDPPLADARRPGGAVRIRVDTRPLGVAEKLWQRFGRDQIPFATSLMVNRLGLTFQREERTHLKTIFEVRRKAFVERAVKKKPKATKRRPITIVSIDPPGGQDRADILTKFEEDTKKTPFRGRTLAVPGPGLKRGKTGVITKAQRIGAFKFRNITPRVAVGEKRTFLIRTGPTRGYIFQRKGRGSGARVVLLYALVPQVPIRPDLDFLDTASKVVRRDAAKEFEKALTHAIATAR